MHGADDKMLWQSKVLEVKFYFAERLNVIIILFLVSVSQVCLE